MKKILTVSVLMLACFAASAGTTSSGSGSGAGGSQKTDVTSTAGATSNNGGQQNAQNITFTSPGETTSTITSTATVNQNVSGTQTINNNQNVSGGTDSHERIDYGTQIIRNTPSVSGPPLVSSNDTCMGSASGSANIPGFGLSVGKTYTDANCVMLKNARELWNMGMKGAAMARMCMDAENREALEMTGFTCPQTLRARGQAYNAGATTTTVVTTPAAPAADSSVYTGNDPIVRRRLGLPVKE